MHKYSFVNMKLREIFTFFLACFLTMEAYADITLDATYTNKEGAEISTQTNFSEEAPLQVHFSFDLSQLPAGAIYVWHIRNRVTGTNLTRYEQEIDFEFTEAGLTEVTLEVLVDDEVVDSGTIGVTITESFLEMPNAFSPNGDQTNDVYRAKQKTLKSIVEFHAYIFNRHGQKLYEWHDVHGGWDGTYNGHPVKDGVYYAYVKARGADGKDYEFRRDVNLLRNKNTIETTE